MQRFDCPPGTIIRIVASDIFAGDAIGNFNLQLRALLQSINIPCRLYAANYDALQDQSIAHFDQFFEDYGDGDVLFAHFSIYEKRNKLLAELDLPKAVYYHGITPPEYFYPYDPVTADNCARGLEQFDCFADYDFYMANSVFMLEQLFEGICKDDMVKKEGLRHRSAVCPPFLSTSEALAGAKGHAVRSGETTLLLYVGRVAPHKCVHELLELLAALVSQGENASLAVVGGCAAVKYCDELDGLLRGKFSGIQDRVRFFGHVSDVRLDEIYAQSDAFVTMSEHEGFCLPLVEAMHHGLPVMAKGRGAIPETMSGAGMVFDSNDYDAMIRYIKTLKDDEVRSAIVVRQNAVYEKIIKSANGSPILSVLRKLVNMHRPS